LPDLRFNVDQAAAALRKDVEYKIDQLKEYAARLERELREVAAALERGDAIRLAEGGAMHVMEMDSRARGPLPTGAEIQLMAFGNFLGISRLAQPLEPGRYRILVQFVEIKDGD